LAVLISSVEKNSHAEKAGISVGESLVSINGNQIKDVLDYRFYMTDKKLEIELLKDGATRTVTLEKQ
jgi:NifB/MoaA-like Fe-S oxidoreductase